MCGGHHLRGHQIVIWMRDNFEKHNYSTSKTVRFALETHSFRDFANLSFKISLILGRGAKRGGGAFLEGVPTCNVTPLPWSQDKARPAYFNSLMSCTCALPFKGGIGDTCKTKNWKCPTSKTFKKFAFHLSFFQMFSFQCLDGDLGHSYWLHWLVTGSGVTLPVGATALKAPPVCVPSHFDALH